MPKHGEGYQLLLPWPVIEQLCFNIYWTGEVSIDKAQVFRYAQPTPERALRKHKSAEEVTQMYRELKCFGDFPEVTTAIEVPFKLRVIMVVMRKPYNMSREGKVWLKSEPQKMLDAKKNSPSTSSFTSPVTIVPKVDGSFHLYTDYWIITQQTSIFVSYATNRSHHLRDWRP